MPDSLLISKAAVINRCVTRVREEYDKDPLTFSSDPSRQDAAMLNILRAFAAAQDMGHHLIHRENLGVPQGTTDVFELLRGGGWLEASQLTIMKKLANFRDIAVDDSHALQMPITVAIVTQHLDDFLRFSSFILTRDAG